MNEPNVEMMLEKLAEMIRIGKKPLIGPGRIVDENECLTLITQIKEMIPKEFSEAKVVLQERDNIIQQAHDTAESMLSEAEIDANRMLNESDIIQQAQREGNKIVAAAQAYADNIQQQYFSKIVEVLQMSEGYLKNTLDNVVSAKYDVVNQINASKRNTYMNNNQNPENNNRGN